MLQHGLKVQRQLALPVIYNDVKLDAGYRIDLLVEDEVIVELKSIEAIAPIHEAQLLTYLKLSQKKLNLPKAVAICAATCNFSFLPFVFYL